MWELLDVWKNWYHFVQIGRVIWPLDGLISFRLEPGSCLDVWKVLISFHTERESYWRLLGLDIIPYRTGKLFDVWQVWYHSVRNAEDLLDIWKVFIWFHTERESYCKFERTGIVPLRTIKLLLGGTDYWKRCWISVVKFPCYEVLIGWMIWQPSID